MLGSRLRTSGGVSPQSWLLLRSLRTTTQRASLLSCNRRRRTQSRSHVLAWSRGRTTAWSRGRTDTGAPSGCPWRRAVRRSGGCCRGIYATRHGVRQTRSALKPHSGAWHASRAQGAHKYCSAVRLPMEAGTAPLSWLLERRLRHATQRVSGYVNAEAALGCLACEPRASGAQILERPRQVADEGGQCAA
jgi:hypothetical protein